AAAAARNGVPSVRLGDAYASYGRYPEAIAAFQQGLGKGGLDHPEEAKLHLGIAWLAAGERAKAASMLESVAGEGGARDLAQLWLMVQQTPAAAK
ncbi:MAG TPA: hypothetical protein VE397_06865, partial [Stellaceae bacterium]|nr:hypothetical protein [Stellaceae bacterium]